MAATEHRGSAPAEAGDGEVGGSGFAAPSIALPKGGGAVRGIGEKFGANPVTGTGSLAVPIPISPGRSGFGPQLSLSYDSGAGSGVFGFGWDLSLPSITRKTDKGLPLYRDAEGSDVFVLSGAEDLVPVTGELSPPRTVDEMNYRVERYRPRVEGLFARIERWTPETGEAHWRSISRDNVTTLYGKDETSRIAEPVAPGSANRRVFSWLISESYDDKGNAVVYTYKPEDSTDVALAQANERNRLARREPPPEVGPLRQPRSRLVEPDLKTNQWMFEVVFDYGEHDPQDPRPGDQGPWTCRHDPFSTYRAGFEVRTNRLCRRVLMFHHFPGEADVGDDCLVRSLDMAYKSSRGEADDVTRGNPIASLITSITQTGYRRNHAGGDPYVVRSLPPLEFEYSEAIINEDVQEVDAESLENLPSGVDGSSYQWVDLDGEGVSGILSEQAGAWYYKPSLGEGRFGPVQAVAAQAVDRSARRWPSAAAGPRGRRSDGPRRTRRPDARVLRDGPRIARGRRFARSARCRTSTGRTRTCVSSISTATGTPMF